jgi:regulator of sirC expression with transglutaminase-like and TPR domain
MTADERLAEIAALPEDAIDVTEAALWIAAAEAPETDVEAARAALEALARSARERVPADGSPPERVAALVRHLFEEQGFRGNERDYHDPRNSFLGEVLERRTGLPITLSIVTVEVGRRIGLDLVGVGFPGHFLVKHRDPEVLLDPFHGRIVSRAECEAKLVEMLGDEAVLDETHLDEARPREILVRMLRNLKHLFVNRGDFARALATVSRILLFVPDDASEIRDRGILHLRLECFGAALRDLERSLELEPGGAAAEAVRQSLPELRRQVASIQ